MAYGKLNNNYRNEEEMNKKAINSVLSKKFEDWLKSIEDKDLLKKIRNGTIITGGCFVNLLENEKPKDYDLYFKDKETALSITNYYVDIFNKNNSTNCAEVKVEESGRIRIYIASAGIAAEDKSILDDPFEDVYDVLNEDDREERPEMDATNMLDKADSIGAEELEKEVKEKYRPVFLSSNAITLSGDIQLVIRFYGSPEEIHDNYDFIHCTNYWTSWERKVVLKAEALESIITKQLFYSGSKYPLCSIIRTRKFIKRGWHINAGQYLKMCMQLSKLDLSDVKVLEDQLVGVDSAYFNMLIVAINNKMEKDPEFRVDDSYVCSIIDKIF